MADGPKIWYSVTRLERTAGREAEDAGGKKAACSNLARDPQSLPCTRLAGSSQAVAPGARRRRLAAAAIRSGHDLTVAAAVFKSSRKCIAHHLPTRRTSHDIVS